MIVRRWIRRRRQHAALVLVAVMAAAPRVAAQDDAAVGIAWEEVRYPQPVRFLPIVLEGHAVRMAYMDVAPAAGADSARATVVLLHGRNFGGDYWADTIERLTGAGYRVVVPDQIGFAKSAKPLITYTLDQLAANTIMLLDSLGVRAVTVVGHSMGGMLAVRLARAYQDRVQRLVLENPVGLEDYRRVVPPRSTEDLARDELAVVSPDEIRAFFRRFVAQWTPARDEVWVERRRRLARSAEFPRWAEVYARTYQLIYQQPVRYELDLLVQPTLVVIGLQDRVALGAAFVPPAVAATMGQYPALGRWAAQTIPRARLVEIPGAGHIPHWEAPAAFASALLEFLGAPGPR